MNFFSKDLERFKSYAQPVSVRTHLSVSGPAQLYVWPRVVLEHSWLESRSIPENTKSIDIVIIGTASASSSEFGYSVLMDSIGLSASHANDYGGLKLWISKRQRQHCRRSQGSNSANVIPESPVCQVATPKTDRIWIMWLNDC